MKPSKESFFYVVMGLVIFLFSVTLFMVLGAKQEQVIMIAIGLSGMTFLWVMGIQYDLYELGKKKEGTKP